MRAVVDKKMKAPVRTMDGGHRTRIVKTDCADLPVKIERVRRRPKIGTSIR